MEHSNLKAAVKVLLTGGTIDGLEYSLPKHALGNHESPIPGLLKQAKLSIPYEIEIVMLKDSKFIDDADRALILEKVLTCEEDKIVITYGTMTMLETAKFLGPHIHDKVVVMVGSAVFPFNVMSDAMFNLGSAMMAVQLARPGVYIAINGVLFSWNSVRKNFKTGFFEREKEG